MRKIDKTCDLSTVYKAWVDGLEAKQAAHPKYENTKAREEYYLDIVMQLHHCQGGLCAYTERSLCAKKHFAKRHWTDGKYAATKPGDNIEGHLDHFDPNLKSKKGDASGRKDWLWDNFFMIHGHVNSIVKAEKPVDDILKPDGKDYDSFNLLDYDPATHSYIPQPSLDEGTQKRVKEMLGTLGVNHFNNLRRSHLEDKLKSILTQSKNWGDLEIIEYPTAFKFCKKKIEKGEITFESLFAKSVVDRDDFLVRRIDDL